MDGSKGQIDKDLLNQRYCMLTNQHASPVGDMMPWAELEIMQHCRLIDEIRAQFGCRPFSDYEMKRCYKRFRRLCAYQWKNRN